MRDPSRLRDDLQVALAHVARRKDHTFLVLDLEHWALLRLDLPRGPELERSVEGRDVERGEAVAQRQRVDRAGFLRRRLQRDADDRRRGLAVVGYHVVARGVGAGGLLAARERAAPA